MRMAETKRQEHERLQERTDTLREEHEGLSLDRAPFNKADHDDHDEHLRDHKRDLAAHRRRPEDAEK